MNQEMKLAVLIDAENISSKYIDVILSEANNLGDVIYKRIYGNWTTPQMASWRNTILDNAIQPIQQYSNTIRKNSSDSALIIDTMDLLYQSNLDGFCIVSSDSDFTRLASRLRESQKYVLGMGESKTPRSFISACNKFLYLDVLWEEAEEHEAGDHEGTDHEEAQAEHTSPQAKAEKPEADNHASETPAARPLTPPETMPLHGKTPGKDFSTIRQALHQADRRKFRRQRLDFLRYPGKSPEQAVLRLRRPQFRLQEIRSLHRIVETLRRQYLYRRKEPHSQAQLLQAQTNAQAAATHVPPLL